MTARVPLLSISFALVACASSAPAPEPASAPPPKPAPVADATDALATPTAVPPPADAPPALDAGGAVGGTMLKLDGSPFITSRRMIVADTLMTVVENGDGYKTQVLTPRRGSPRKGVVVNVVLRDHVISAIELAIDVDVARHKRRGKSARVMAVEMLRQALSSPARAPDLLAAKPVIDALETGDFANVSDLGATWSGADTSFRREFPTTSLSLVNNAESHKLLLRVTLIRCRKAAITARITKYTRAIRGCYQKRLMTNPSLSGKLTMRWTIGRKGATRLVTVAADTIKDSSLVECVRKVIDDMRFTPPSSGVCGVEYPFVFQTR